MTTASRTPLCPMVPGHLPAVMAIEQDCFEFPWDEVDFFKTLSCSGMSFGMIAKREEQLAGFIVAKAWSDEIEVLNIAVARGFRRRGVGTELIDELTGILRHRGRQSIFTHVREKNDEAIAFFRKLGFRATGLLHDYYDDVDEDAIRFEWRLRPRIENPNLAATP